MMENTAIADELRAHYARVAPLLDAAFGGGHCPLSG